MLTITRYPTRPLQTWTRMKELRRQVNRHGWDIKDTGGLIVGTQNPAHAILAGIGPWARRLYGPYFSKAMQNPDVLSEYHDAADVRGFPRGEMCSSMHHYIGEMLLGHTTVNPWSGTQSPVDLVFETEFCHSVAKTAQLAGELLGVPHFVLDVPQDGGEPAVRYVASRMHEAIDFLVRVSGKEYQDELLIEAVENWWEQGVLFARICYANRAVPATLDFSTLSALWIPSVVAGHRREVVDYLAEVLAEVEERVRDGISIAGVETARLSHEGEPMYYAEHFVPDLVRRYGAVLVGGYIAFGQGIWDIGDDGRWTPAPRFRELGVSLHDRDSALEFLARCFVERSPLYHCQRLSEKVGEYLYRAQDWGCHGSIIHLDIGCRSQAVGVLEARRAIEQSGFPTVTYVASNGDYSNFSPHQISGALESFLERLGLRPIE